MPVDPVTPLIAVDVGNSRIKLGLFDRGAEIAAAVEPIRILELPAEDWDIDRLKNWLPSGPIWPEWWVATVNRPAAARLVDWIGREEGLTPSGHPVRVRRLSAENLPLAVGVEHPERVGIDRLAAATAADRLRTPRRAALVVDAGSAITVDFVSADGVFLGGAILPGMNMASRALHEFTDLLPLVPPGKLDDPPAPLGISTVTAIRSGLYWGAIGAVRELARGMSAGCPAPPEVFLTGGAASMMSRAFDRPVQMLPHLVLSGIALARR